MPVDLSCKVVQSKDLIATELDGELVMMSIQEGNYYGLDALGRVIWERLVNPCRVGELCDALLAEYKVDRERCESEVLNFLSQMEAQGLIEVLPA